MKILICGTRGKVNRQQIYSVLNQLIETDNTRAKVYDWSIEIIEGCCPNSADEVAEQWATENNIKVHHFPSTTGNYLKRNIEMVQMAEMVIAFWDGWSYGTAHTIANGVMKGIPVKVHKIMR